VAVSRVGYAVPGWGVGELWLSDGRVVEIDHPRPGREAGGRHELAERLAAWFAGSRDDFAGVELELDWCTPFQRALVDALRAVPYGETVTYGELAALAGRPGAARAAGALCATNRFAVIVPCHRVVAAGGLGGYGELGLAYKRRLLALEALWARAPRSYAGGVQRGASA
jgi:methylated-DNA-[protein]-cysteine S-methyltransferase